MAELEACYEFLFEPRSVLHPRVIGNNFSFDIFYCAYHLIAWFLTSKMDNGMSSRGRCDPDLNYEQCLFY